MEDKVKSKTIVNLFIEEFNLDAYLLRHKYGLAKPSKIKELPDMSYF